mgnify:CR=1 FL=1
MTSLPSSAQPAVSAFALLAAIVAAGLLAIAGGPRHVRPPKYLAEVSCRDLRRGGWAACRQPISSQGQMKCGNGEIAWRLVGTGVDGDHYIFTWRTLPSGPRRTRYLAFRWQRQAIFEDATHQVVIEPATH